MRDFDLQHTLLFGNAKEGTWTGGVVSSIESNKTKQFGQLFLVLTLEAPSEFDTAVAGDLLIENFQEVYFDEEVREESLIRRLEKSILSAAKRLEVLLQREKVASEKGIDMAVTAAVVKGNFIYMAILGEGGVFLMRDSQLISVTNGLKDLSGRDLIRSGSGEIIENDTFIILSPQALVEIPESELRLSIKSKSVDNLKLKKSNPHVGMVMIQCRSEVDEESKEAAAISPVMDEGDLDKTKSEKFEADDGENRLEVEEPLDDGLPTDQKEVLSTEDPLDDKQADGVDKIPDEEPSVTDESITSEGGLPSNIKQKITDKKTYQVLLLKLKDIVIVFFEFLKLYIWGKALGMGSRGMYIKGAGPRRSLRGIIILILIVASLLFISIRTINRNKEEDQRGDEVQQILSEVSEKFEDGRNLGSVGNVASSIEIVEEGMAQLRSVEEQGVLLDEINTKLDEGHQILDEVKKVIVITEKNRITDIAGFIEDVEVDDMVVYQGKVYISDTKNGLLYQVNAKEGDVNVSLGEESILASPHALTMDNGGNLLIVDNEKGLLSVNLSDKSVQEIAGLSSSSVGSVTASEYYTSPDGSEYLYLLRAQNNDVRKISRYTSGFSLPVLRLADTKFSSAVDLEIDGKIYVLTNAGTILRYYGDVLDPYTLTGLDKPLGSTSAFELDDTLVYIGDSGNKRVVVVTKGSTETPQKGKFVAQIEYRGEGEALGTITNIFVDDENRVAYILDGTTLFKLELTKIDEYKKGLE